MTLSPAFISILTIILNLIIAIVQSVLVKKVNDSITAHKEDSEKARSETKAIKNGIMALLGDSIDKLCIKALNEDNLEVMSTDLAKINHLFEPYTILGGNGVIKTEVDTVTNTFKEKLKAV